MTKTYKLIENLLEVAECYSDGRETYEPFEQILREARSYLNNEKSVMTDQHPITPPPELVQQWIASETYRYDAETGEHPDGSYEQRMCDLAAQWGADQELEACCEWLSVPCPSYGRELRNARRPKPPSLKGQALEQLDGIAAVFRMTHGGDLVCDKILRALEASPDD
jgi:hypothetical protein